MTISEAYYEIANMFSHYIQMEFGLDKCRIQAICKGHHEPHTEHSISDLHIQAMTETYLYKYLGILQGTHRKSHLSRQNKISALNVFAIPSLAYAFEIFPWTKTDLENIQRRIRTTVTKFQMHHSNSAAEQIHFHRDIGNKGMIDVAAQH